MTADFLALNCDNTKIILIENPKRLTNAHDFTLSVGSSTVKTSHWTRNLAGYFDRSHSSKKLIQKAAAFICCHPESPPKFA